MIRNYIKVAFRSLFKSKVATLVNVMGLSISMVVGIFLFGMLKSNWETDHFHPYMDRTFRILTKSQSGEETRLYATVPNAVVEYVNHLSAVEKSVRVRDAGSINVVNSGGEIPVNVIFTEPSFFEVFGFRTNGQNKPLSNPNSVLLSEEIAEKLFGREKPLGQLLKFDGWGSYIVTGIIQKPSQASHIPIEVVFSINEAASLQKRRLLAGEKQDWDDYKSTALYVLTHSNTGLVKLNKDLQVLDKQKAPRSSEKLSFYAQDLESVTPWNPQIVNDTHAGMNWSGILLWIFLALALTVLASFNYTALSVARILTRAREVGIRKTNGARKREIFIQFVVEASLMALISLFVAYLIVLAIYNGGGLRFGTSINVVPDLYFVLILLFYAVLTGVVAGVIPAWVLAKFKPIDVLKNLKAVPFLLKVSFHKAIIVVQFSVAVMLMIFFVILKDSSFNLHKELLEKVPEDVVVVNLKGKDPQILSNEIEKLSQVKSVSISNYLPISTPLSKCTVRVDEAEEVISYADIDQNFLKVYDMKLKAGSNISSEQYGGNEHYVLLNESAARQLKLKGTKVIDYIGQFIKVDSLHIQIIGIVEDPLIAGKIQIPSLFRFSKTDPAYLSIKTTPNASKIVEGFLGEIWDENYSNFIPEIYSYKGRILEQDKAGREQLSMTFGLLCSVVMFVAALGILGMGSYAVQSNKMQIGIRKTFGANNRQILFSVTYPFFKLLLSAGIVGTPLGWFAGSLLRSRLGANVDLGFQNLFSGFFIVVAIALLMVISQTYQSMFVEPSKVLRGD